MSKIEISNNHRTKEIVYGLVILGGGLIWSIPFLYGISSMLYDSYGIGVLVYTGPYLVLASLSFFVGSRVLQNKKLFWGIKKGLIILSSIVIVIGVGFGIYSVLPDYPDCWSGFKIYYDNPVNFDDSAIENVLSQKYDEDTMYWVTIREPDENGMSSIGIPTIIGSTSPEGMELMKNLGEINHVVKVEGGRVACA